MVTVDVYTIILLISQFHTFFSLFSMCKTNSVSDFSSPHLLFPQTHINTPTHKHIHTEKSIQRYTNTPTRTNQQRDRSVLVLVTCGLVLVVLDQSSWVNGNGFGCLWVSVGGRGRCLGVDKNEFWFLWFLWGLILVVLMVEIGACGG